MSIEGIANIDRSTNANGVDELQVRDGNTIDTGRYEIKSTKDHELWIKDTHDGKWVKLWGDPHGKTSDGDRFQFHEDTLTFELADGTKVSVIPTEKNSNGKAYLDQVHVMKGDEAYVMAGLSDGKAGVFISEELDAASLDRAFGDGTVLQVRDQIDDLFYAADGRELVGSDPNGGEWLVDGSGGRASTFHRTSYGSIESRLNAIHRRMSSELEKMADRYDRMDQVHQEQQRWLANHEVPEGKTVEQWIEESGRWPDLGFVSAERKDELFRRMSDRKSERDVVLTAMASAQESRGQLLMNIASKF